MTELTLYKFINENAIEYHWHDKKDGADVIAFIPFFNIKEFASILPSTIFDDEGIKCTMKEGYFAFWMNDICEYYGVDINNVFVNKQS